LSLVVVLLLSTIPSPSHCRRKGKHCEIPPDWHGQWFEFGQREAISISAKNISHKGHCITSRTPDKFIFHDRKAKCSRCAVIYKKHHNVIQYKESLCVPSYRKKGILELCYRIGADTSLKSMFRLETEPWPCPIGQVDAAYQFSYAKGHGECNYPLSSMNMCSDQSRMVMRYQACADVKGSETSVKEVQCYGSWKEGSTHYFLGMLNDSHLRRDNYEGRFRCFAHQKIFNGFKLSQSGDARCDIWSPDEGYVTMRINKVSSPGDECRLPDWVLANSRHTRYLSLDKSVEYKIDPNSTVTVTSTLTSSKKLTCSRLVKEQRANFSRMIMQVNFDCESGFICLEMTRKSGTVMTVRQGRLSRNPEEACDQTLFFDAHIKPTLLVSQLKEPGRCPLVGKYSIVDDGSKEKAGTGCPNEEPSSQGIRPSSGHLSFGCSGAETTFKLYANDCQTMKTTDGSTFQEFSCQSGWKEPLSPVLPSEEIIYQSRDLQMQGQPEQPPPHRQQGFLQYMILTSKNSSERLCAAVRIEDPLDLASVQLTASPRACPTSAPNHATEPFHQSETGVWNFRLHRQSECAQALATANTGTLTTSNPQETIILVTSTIWPLLATLARWCSPFRAKR